MTSCLYLISEGPNGPVKLGRSTKPAKRLKWLQTGNPRQLKLVAAWESDWETVSATEQELLSDYAYFGVAVVGEWVFLPESEMLEDMQFLGSDFRRVV